MTSRFSDIRFHPADREHRDAGVLGWISAQIGSAIVDGITCRRTPEGAVTVDLPERRGAGGTCYPVLRLRGHVERAELELELIGYVEARGWI